MKFRGKKIFVYASALLGTIIIGSELFSRYILGLGSPPLSIRHPLHDELSLRILYSAADVMAIPSRQDNLPNTGLEAHACGTPVIAFNTCGLPDIVEHLKTGYLAKAFDTNDFAHGIQWLLADRSRLMTLGLAARERAIDKWSVKVVADAYQNVYDYVLLNN